MSGLPPDNLAIRQAIRLRPLDYVTQAIHYYEFGQWHEGWSEWLVRPERHWGLSATDLVRGLISLGLQRDLDKRVAADAIHWLATNPKSELAINVVADSLAAPGYADEMLATLSSHRIHPRRLALEITEHVPVVDLVATANAANQLRQAGVRIGIDDVGRGWHAALTAMDLGFLDYIKIDRRLIMDAMADTLNRARLNSVLQLARERKLEVVAEGIENEAELAVAERLDVRYFQGFYWGAPLPAHLTEMETARKAG